MGAARSSGQGHDLSGVPNGPLIPIAVRRKDIHGSKRRPPALAVSQGHQPTIKQADTCGQGHAEIADCG